MSDTISANMKRRLATCTWLSIALMLAAAEVSSGAVEREAPGRHFTRRSWIRSDGLHGSQIWTIAQDQSGYLWLGTNEGLLRFDGVRFVPWAAAYPQPLPTKSVRSLCVARDGSLW